MGDPGDRVSTPGTNALLLAPSLDARSDETCTSLLTSTPPSGTDVLHISLTQSPDKRISTWRTNVGTGLPAKTAILSVGERTRSTATQSATLPGSPIRLECVSSTHDLTGIGMKVSEILTEWGGDGNQIAVCFHSLTTLLQYADLQRVYRFLHALTGHLTTVDAIAHFHIDPSAHDEQTLATIKSLFDTVVEVDEEHSDAEKVSEDDGPSEDELGDDKEIRGRSGATD